MDPQTIEIDCAPFTPRPDTYIAGVLEGSGIAVREPILKLFGEWTWDFSDVDATTWQIWRPTFKERIIALYNSGAIRYGSW